MTYHGQLLLHDDDCCEHTLQVLRKRTLVCCVPEEFTERRGAFDGRMPLTAKQIVRH